MGAASGFLPCLPSSCRSGCTYSPRRRCTGGHLVPLPNALWQNVAPQPASLEWLVAALACHARIREWRFALRSSHDHRDAHLQGTADNPKTAAGALGLAPGPRLQASVDSQCRLVLVPSKCEPEELLRHLPQNGKG